MPIPLLVLLAALSASTPEEEALRALLAGRPQNAVRTLEAAAGEDPLLRWIAGRVALSAGDLDSARRLAGDETPADRWSLLEVLFAEGEEDEAATLALEEMDEALGGEHRDALARMLLDQAAARAERDPRSSSQMLRAVLQLEASDEMRLEAEDRLFLLVDPSTGHVDEILRVAALKRLETQAIEDSAGPSDPGNLGAKLVAGVALRHHDPVKAYSHFAAVTRHAENDMAISAAREVTTLSLPPDWAISVLDELAERFEEDEELASLRLHFASGLVTRDQRRGTAELEKLILDSHVGGEAAERMAAATSDPLRRRQLRLDLAEREGGSAIGERARAAARLDLLAAVEAVAEGEQRRAMAIEALSNLDGADLPLLLYSAIPDGDERPGELWALTRRFPEGGPWCKELASMLVAEGASREEAERYDAACPGIETKEQEALHAHGSDEGDVFLSMTPKGAEIEVLVAGADRLTVAENPVDPEILFRASEGNPLDISVDAFLVAPKRSYEVEIETDSLEPLLLNPRERGLLTAVTVRANDRRATALVPAELLELQALRFGRILVVAVLFAGEPVSGARLLVLDGAGKSHEARTDREGLAILREVESGARIMARTRRGLGFALIPQGGAEAPTSENVSLVLEDRAYPAEGATGMVRAFATKWSQGEAEGEIILRSISQRGELIEEQTVRLEGGAASAGLVLQGGGRISAVRDNEVVASQVVPSFGSYSYPLAISFSPASPEAGENLTVSLSPRDPVPPGGLEATVDVFGPWHHESHEVTLKNGETVDLDLSLRNSHPGATVQVVARIGAHGTGGGPQAQAAVMLSGPAAPALPDAPSTVAVGASLGKADVWRIARLPAFGTEIWVAPGEELILPEWVMGPEGSFRRATGGWRLTSWNAGARSEELGVLALEENELDPTRLVWKGSSPLLTAMLEDGEPVARLLRSGEELPRPRVDGHLGLADSEELGREEQVPGLFLPPARRGPIELTVEGSLVRGEPAELLLGDDLPAGTRLWAILRDASDHRHPAGPIEMQRLTPVIAGAAAGHWQAGSITGEEVDAALLAEEERLAEQGPLSRIRLNERIAQEQAGGFGYGVGMVGSGRGGGGLGVVAGRANQAGTAPRVASPFQTEWRALASIGEAGPGPWTLTAPDWVSAAEIEVIARLPDGTWHRRIRRVPVDGPAPGPYPLPEAAKHPESWDGDPASLLTIAHALPIDARIHALAALEKVGVSDATPHLMAALGISAMGPGRSLAFHLGRGQLPVATAALSRLESLADPQRVARAMAALEAAPGAPDAAASAAGRLLREPDLPSWIGARAGLALLVAGRVDEAQAAMSGDDEVAVASRAVTGIVPAPEAAAGLYAMARSEAADPLDRALAIHALSMIPGQPVRADAPGPSPAALKIEVMPALASLGGREFSRGSSIRPRSIEPPLESVDRAPAGRTVPVSVVIEPFFTPTRLRCPMGPGLSSKTEWVTIDASGTPGHATCLVNASGPGPVTLRVDRHFPSGRLMATGSAGVVFEEPRASEPTDPMSLDERFALGVAMAERGLPGAKDLLSPLLSIEGLSAHAVVTISRALLSDAKEHGDPAELVFAFEAARERSRQGRLDLPTAAAVAHAYSSTGEHKRAIAATKAVLDARFREELGAVYAVQSSGLTFSALAALQELLTRYPEVPTVVSARYLAPSMLLERAAGEGDRLGYTRSSLRHTAAAELSRFLLLHPDEPTAPEAAVLLADTLRLLRNPARERALSGPLVEKYGSSPAGWRLAVADARARFATGDLRGAAAVLENVRQEGAAAAAVSMERGRIAEARGEREEALRLYKLASTEEALLRSEWLNRADLTPPEVITLRREDPRRIEAALFPGTRVEVSATRIVLENLLLRDGGEIEPSMAVVDGLAAERTTTVRADSLGNLPLPRLNRGAWLVTTSAENNTSRFLVLRGDHRLDVRPEHSGGALVHLRDHRGRPVEGASIWAARFGETFTATTDSLGAAWLPTAAGSTVLARIDRDYAIWTPDATVGYPPHGHHQRRAPARRPVAPAYDFEADTIGGLLEKNVAGFDQLFQQDRTQTLPVTGF